MITVVLLAIVISAITYYIYRAKTYWTRRGVPTYGNILTGCFTKTFRAQENLAVGLEDLYHRTKHEKYVGTYILGQPILVINDPEIIKEVFLTEYPSFASHGMVPSSKTDTVSGHLFVLEGAEWKFIRSKMSPSFSSGKLKSMVPIIVEKVRHCERKMSEQGSTTVVYNAYMRKLSIDVIFACFMGIEANCLDSKSSKFLDVSYMLNTPTYGQFANTILYFNFRKLSDLFLRTGVTNFLPGFADQFLADLSNQFIKMRSQDGGNKRNDFMDTMVKLWRESENGAKEKVTEGTIAAQIFVMFAAGFETTSQANTYMLFEMARQPEIMRKVQEECDRLLKETGGEITYELLAKMEYTDKVIKETIRIYPALHFLTRSNIKACKLPLTDVELEKDTSIWIPLRGMHRDPNYFPDPDKFDPERFSKENIQSIPPNVFMPFGDGPRTCIGMRFAMLSIKTTVLTILSKYDIRLTAKTPKKMEFEPLVYFPVPAQDVPLDLVPRNT